MDLETIVKELGFESTQEFNAMVAAVDLSNPAKQDAFVVWKESDGTKVGLQKLTVAK